MPSDVLITPASSKIEFTDGANATKTLKITGTSLNTDTSFAIGATTANNTLSVLGSASIGSSYNVAGPTNGLIVQGNIGIGITSPSNTKLHIVGDWVSGHSTVKVQGITDNTTGYGFYDTAGSRLGYLAYTGAAFEWYNNANVPIIFYTNTSERMRIAADGKVGIGTTSPTQKLDIVGSYATAGDSSGILKIRGGATGGDTQLNFGVSADGGYGWIQATDVGITNNINIVLNPIGGNVGIGTTSPVGKLHIEGAYPQLVLNNASAGSGCVIQLKDNGTNRGAIGHFTLTSALQFSSAGLTPQMTLDSNGNLGIGITNPSQKLYVAGTGFASSDFRAPIFYDSDNISYYLDPANSTTSLLVAGNVGIGTTTPSYRLHVSQAIPTGTTSAPANTSIQVDSNTNNYLSFVNTADNGTYAGLTFVDNNVGGYIVFRNYTGDVSTGSDSLIYGTYQDHIFQTGTTSGINSRNEVLRIKNNGNVGVGVNSPNNKLHVNGSMSIGSGYNTAGPTNGLLVQGNVGIGMTTTNYKLNVSTSAAQGFTLITNTSTVGGPQIDIYDATRAEETVISSTDGTTVGSYIASYLNHPLLFGAYASVSPTAKMVIATSGNVGIGVINPLAQLHINEATSGAAALRVDGTNGTLFSVVDDLSDSLMSVNNSAGLPVLEVFADDRVVMGQYGQNDFVLRNNKVGIGIANPNNKLHVYNSSGSSTIASNAIAVFEQSSNAGIQVCVPDASEAGLFFSRSGATYYSAITRNGTDLLLKNNSATAVTINSSGNVGVGGTPSARLHVIDTNQSPATGNLLVSSTGGNASIRIDSNASTNYTYLTLSQGGTGKFELGIVPTSSDFYINPTVQSGANGAAIYVKKADGNVGINSTSPNSPLTVYNNSDVWHFRLGGASGELRMGGQTNSGAVIQAYTPGGSVRDLYLQRDGGNIGISTNSPTAKLHMVATGGDGTPALRIVGSASDTFNWASSTMYANLVAAETAIHLIGKAQSQYNSAYLGYRHVADGSSSNMLSLGLYSADHLVNILGNGNVGIGTSVPAALLQIGSGTPTSATGGLQFGDDTGTRLYRSSSGVITCSGTIAATFSGNLTGNITGNASGSSTFVASLGSGLNYDNDRTTKRAGLSHYSGYSTGTNRPTTYDYTLQVTDGNKGWEISMDWIATTGPAIYARSLRDCCQNWSSWVRILDSANYSFAANMNQNVRTTDGVTFANITGNGQLNINHSSPTAIARLWSGGSTIWSLGVGDASGSYFNISADFGSFTINKSNGYVGIGTTSQTTRLQLGSGTPTASADGIQFGGDTSARIYRSSSAVVSVSNSFAAAGGYVYASNYLQTGNNLIYPAGFSSTQRLAVGNAAQNNWIDGLTLAPGGNVVIAGTLTESSSIRYKENIETISAPILPKLNKIRPVTYNKKDNPKHIEYGIIAEELNELFPEFVNKNESGEVESVNYSRLTVILIKAVKELQEEVEKLKNK